MTRFIFRYFGYGYSYNVSIQDQNGSEKNSTDTLTFALDPVEWEQMNKLSEHKNNKLERNTTSRHNKKLNDLGINIIKPAYTNYINTKDLITRI